MRSLSVMGSVKSIFFCKQKEHRDSRAPLAELKRELEKYIGKLGTTIVDSNIQFAVNLRFQTLGIKDSSESSLESSHGINILPSAPTIDSETGLLAPGQDKNICLRALRVPYI